MSCSYLVAQVTIHDPVLDKDVTIISFRLAQQQRGDARD